MTIKQGDYLRGNSFADLTDAKTEGMIRESLRTEAVGDLIREWRKRRRMSQLDLALEADVSARHLSFVESGRSGASRDLLQRLGERLAMPLRERNRLLVAGGYAPLYTNRSLDEPAMEPALTAVESILAASEPYPALVVDRLWNLVRPNAAAGALLVDLPSRLTDPPMNVLRATLDPEGLSQRIINLPQWRHHLLSRLRSDFTATGDARLAWLRDELAAYPMPRSKAPIVRSGDIAVPLLLQRAGGGPALSLISTTTMFGTANDVTLAELTLESFFPADSATRDYFLATKQC